MIRLTTFSLLILLIMGSDSSGQTKKAAQKSKSAAGQTNPPAPPPPPPLPAGGFTPKAAPPAAAGFKDDFFKQLDDVEKKIVTLAEAFPQAKLSWRPAPGIKSASEVFMHIAAANFLIPKSLGVNPPSGISRDVEKVTDKAMVVQLLQQSFKHVRDAVNGVSEADMDKRTKLFGMDATYRYAIFLMAIHMHEHLGQSIAYARTNGVVPPWSAKE